MRTITVQNFAPIAMPPELGAAPMLQWIPIDLLVIDDTYQRKIGAEGKRNVRAIAEGFRWSKFAPVVVSPVAGGKYSIVDGQHRATAAALLQIESVPCQVIVASQSEQAEAFHAINGAITRITMLQLHTAAVVAGDPAALETLDVCRRAGVEILRYPLQALKQKPGQTRCVRIIGACIKTFGADTVIAALRCVSQTANRETLGILQGPVIRALCELVRDCPAYAQMGEQLYEAFDEIDIQDHLEAARAKRKVKGEVTATVLLERLEGELANALSRAPSRAA